MAWIQLNIWGEEEVEEKKPKTPKEPNAEKRPKPPRNTRLRQQVINLDGQIVDAP